MNTDNIKTYANEGRRERIRLYRECLKLNEDDPITEENLSDYALNRVCVVTGCDKNRLKAEVLGQKWSDYED